MLNARETVMKWVFFVSALASILAIALICLFLFVNGVPAMAEIGVFSFLLGKNWMPSGGIYGILPMIMGSIYVTAGALAVGVPIGILCAVYLACFCPKHIYRFLRPMVELLAGIPSVIYGFFGIVVVVPLVRDIFKVQGLTMLTASLLLGVMILPTIITVGESAIRAVPGPYFEGALALGASKERGVFFVLVPAAKSGIMAGVVLGIGRAIGETMAVIMVAGNQPRMPAGILKGVRTMTANIVMEMGYAADLHRGALIATGVVLFVFILLINLLVSLLRTREKP
ncbi:MAG: phosphate ABC transporter permease subunit PstC [Clostridiales bacterium]|nr:phosphate ABC transporter permease subunit PstC [Clostridiales bacterium]